MHSGDFASSAKGDEFFLEEGDRHFTHPVGGAEAMFLNELVGDIQGDLHVGLRLGGWCLNEMIALKIEDCFYANFIDELADVFVAVGCHEFKVEQEAGLMAEQV
jgi:hypothetical protein